MAKFSCAAGGNPIIMVQPWVVETSLGNVLGLTPQQYREILIQMQTTRLRHYLFAAEFVLNPGRAEAGSNTHTHTREQPGAQPCLAKLEWEFTNSNYCRV